MDDKGSIHVLVFPWLAFGHMIPYLEASKGLAKRGNRITFVSTQRNIERLPKLPQDLAPRINLVGLPLPRVEGLPEYAEATIDLPPDKIQYLKKALDGLQEPLAALLERISTPDWIIHDFAAYWVPTVASRFGIPCAYLSIFTAATLAVFGPPWQLVARDSWSMAELTRPPWVPFLTNVAFRPHEAENLCQDGPHTSGVSDRRRYGLMVQGCHAILVRTCTEFEGNWLRVLQEIYQKPVLPVGVLPPSIQESTTDDEGHVLNKGLDNQAPGSAVYIAFGSEVRPSREQLHELAFGIELSKLPFVWALRSPPDEPAVLPVGFEDRTKDRGVVHMGWVPQPRILAHTSIGGFLTHGGLSSIIEALAFGKPLVAFPLMADQPLNARMIEEKKIGVEVPRNEWDGSFDRGDVAKLLRLVMVDAEGEQYRATARAMKEIFSDHSIHDRYMDNVVEYLKDHKHQYGPPASPEQSSSV